MPLSRKSNLLEVMLAYIQVKPSLILTSQLPALIHALRRWKVTVTKVLWIGRVWIRVSKRFLVLRIKATSVGHRKFKITKRPTPTLLQLSALTVFTRMLRHSMVPYMASTSRKEKQANPQDRQIKRKLACSVTENGRSPNILRREDLRKQRNE